MVIVLVLVVVGFIRGLERSIAVSGDPKTAIVFSLGMGQNLEYSSIAMRTSDLVPASVGGIQERFGQAYVSPELYLGTQVDFQRQQTKEESLDPSEGRQATVESLGQSEA